MEQKLLAEELLQAGSPSLMGKNRRSYQADHLVSLGDEEGTCGRLTGADQKDSWLACSDYILEEAETALDYAPSPSLGTWPKWHHLGTVVFFPNTLTSALQPFWWHWPVAFCCFSGPWSCKQGSEDSCSVTLHSDHSFIKPAHHTPVLVMSHPLPTWVPNMLQKHTPPIRFPLLYTYNHSPSEPQ